MTLAISGDVPQANALCDGFDPALEAALKSLIWSGSGAGVGQVIFAPCYMVSYGGMNPMHAFDPEGHDHDEHHEDHHQPPTSTRGRQRAEAPRLRNNFTPSADLSSLLGLLRRQRGSENPSITV